MRGGKTRGFVRIFTFLVALSATISLYTSARADGYIKQNRFKKLPSTIPNGSKNNEDIQIIKVGYGCFASYSGIPVNCRFRQELTGIRSPETDTENNGGHSHFDNRPLTYRGGALKVTNSTDLDSTPYGVMGFTKTTSSFDPNWGWAYVEYEVPQASGIVMGESELKITTNDWVCASNCYTRDSWRFADTYDIGVPNLIELPGPFPGVPGINYTKSRKSDSKHTNDVAFHATGPTIYLLILVAEEYKELSGRILSVNDMSLPRGGVFDIKGGWGASHYTHNAGKDADINRDGIQCEDNDEMDDAVAAVTETMQKIDNAWKANLVCEKSPPDDPCPEGVECKYHIDFES